MSCYEQLARQLYANYYNYYCTVHFAYLVQAVQDTMRILHGVTSIEELHQHIKENYI